MPFTIIGLADLERVRSEHPQIGWIGYLILVQFCGVNDRTISTECGALLPGREIHDVMHSGKVMLS
jgi:hypothetical protein